MAWNEPGGDNKDPWGGRGGGQQPPDLDEVVRKLQERVSKLFGGGGGGSGGGATPIRPSGGGISIGLGLIAAVIGVVWIFSGVYIVGPAERGVVTRFGAFAEPPTMPGPHWHMPFPVETVEKVDVDQVRSVPMKALMLTQDENIVAIELAVQYKVKDAGAYLFSVRDPDLTLQEVSETAVREVVGRSEMDFVLKEGRSDVVARTKGLIQEALDQYKTGLIVTSVNLQDAQPPEQVQGAFEDAIRAREDEERFKNEAEAYANDIIPKARGGAARQREEANGYKESVIAEAQGEASRFEQLLTEYQKAPEVTRQRLYIDAMESVLNKSSKVLIDVEGGNSLMYLPLDQMMKRGALGNSGESATRGYRPEPQGGSSTPRSSGTRARDTQRSREVR
ncbi:HflK protein [Solemya pervernicosa gill symbiont]|uniref:Protein HflK n=2 Tax=Gammaproteobacteria incertae sedis TaxID=118884 RepID=A0A1T2L7J8_9GAMM|nr:FtsH protease activity modulator HflK [Candidatus Reidiella endopervernicosa]OOZ41085.1 HflK protein [Solemya pervernicosa gill symbiont]QKQ26246.1 FtsH protease activity modulator HflK [Candidatus Reidiella endopervernicosa]